jgi:hypothetical protein
MYIGEKTSLSTLFFGCIYEVCFVSPLKYIVYFLQIIKRTFYFAAGFLTYMGLDFGCFIPL